MKINPFATLDPDLVKEAVSIARQNRLTYEAGAQQIVELTVNKPLLKCVRQLISEEPKRFAMADWQHEEDHEHGPACGTVACIGGWTHLFLREFDEDYKTGPYRAMHAAGSHNAVDLGVTANLFGRSDWPKAYRDAWAWRREAVANELNVHKCDLVDGSASIHYDNADQHRLIVGSRQAEADVAVVLLDDLAEGRLSPVWTGSGTGVWGTWAWGTWGIVE